MNETDQVPPQQAELQREYHRLFLSRGDLQDAVTFARHLEAERLLEVPEVDKGEEQRLFERHLVAHAFHVAAIVTYARPFSKSQSRDRGWEKPAEYTAGLLESLTAEERAQHDRIVLLRNKLVAHSDASASRPFTIRKERQVWGATSRPTIVMSATHVESILRNWPKLLGAIKARLREISGQLRVDFEVDG